MARIIPLGSIIPYFVILETPTLQQWTYLGPHCLGMITARQEGILWRTATVDGDKELMVPDQTLEVPSPHGIYPQISLHATPYHKGN